MTHAPPPGAPEQPRWLTWRRVSAGLLVTALAIVVGGQVGRAEPTAGYRPLLGPPPFEGVCWPLPEAVEFGFAFQLRSDRMIVEPNGQPVRRIELHVDLLDAESAEAGLAESLLADGFREVGPAAGSDPAADRWFERSDYGRVGVAAAALPGVDEDSIVRATMLLDLPTDSLTPVAEAACSDPVQTKRFPAPDWPGWLWSRVPDEVGQR
ncbi:MAG: hypothetical protein WKF79_11435 [Nocardioides sp.]